MSITELPEKITAHQKLSDEMIDEIIEDALANGATETDIAYMVKEMGTEREEERLDEEPFDDVPDDRLFDDDKQWADLDTIDWDQDLSQKCTCGSTKPEEWEHDFHSCDLFDSWDFEHGWAIWDHTTKQLIPVVNRDDEDFDESTYDANPDADKTKTKTKTITVTPNNQWGTGTGFSTWSKCRHYQAPVVLPDGTVVYASSQHHDREKDPIPDLGIYLDGLWKPDTIAFYVGCPDYGIPIPLPWQVLHIAREGVRMAQELKRIEIGCIGGHGRTGMFLAIMALLTMKKPDGKKAIEYIRMSYCKEAIESVRQEWYISCMAAELTGKAWPEEPKPPPPVEQCKCAHTNRSHTGKAMGGKCTVKDCECKRFVKKPYVAPSYGTTIPCKCTHTKISHESKFSPKCFVCDCKGYEAEPWKATPQIKCVCGHTNWSHPTVNADGHCVAGQCTCKKLVEPTEPSEPATTTAGPTRTCQCGHSNWQHAGPERVGRCIILTKKCECSGFVAAPGEEELKVSTDKGKSWESSKKVGMTPEELMEKLTQLGISYTVSESDGVKNIHVSKSDGESVEVKLAAVAEEPSA